MSRAYLHALLVAATFSVAALLSSGCGEGSANNQATATPAVAATETRPVSATPTTTEFTPTAEVSTKPRPVAVPLARFDGSYFAIDYPAPWDVVAAERDLGSYMDTTIERPSDPGFLVRVDVSPARGPMEVTALGAPVRAALVSQPGYRELDYSASTYGPYRALLWEFLVEEHGRLLHRRDRFFVNEDGDHIAVLVQAPAATYDRWTPEFNRVLSSLVVKISTPATLAASPPPVVTAPSQPPIDAGTTDYGDHFCSTHTCIANFDQGNGYIVQCADGEWSHSGGLSGACSYHGGEGRASVDEGTGSYDGSPSGTSSGGGSGYVIPGGTGYPVTCADGSLSNSGGHSGACSHHGGVGG